MNPPASTPPGLAPDLHIAATGHQHAAQVLAIHQAGIDTGHATFETTAPDWESFTSDKLPGHRHVSLNPNGRVLGWVAAAPVSASAVYAGVVEHSVYVAPDTRGRGVGAALLIALIDSTEHAGIWTIQTGIPATPPALGPAPAPVILPNLPRVQARDLQRQPLALFSAREIPGGRLKERDGSGSRVTRATRRTTSVGVAVGSEEPSRTADATAAGALPSARPGNDPASEPGDDPARDPRLTQAKARIDLEASLVGVPGLMRVRSRG